MKTDLEKIADKLKKEAEKVGIENFAEKFHEIEKMVAEASCNFREEKDFLRGFFSQKLKEDGYIESHFKSAGGGTYEVFPGWIMEEEDSEGGYEGGGEDHWMVFSLREKDSGSKSFWYVPGWYASYDGKYLNWDLLFKVDQKKKMVNDWVKVEG